MTLAALSSIFFFHFTTSLDLWQQYVKMFLIHYLSLPSVKLFSIVTKTERFQHHRHFIFYFFQEPCSRRNLHQGRSPSPWSAVQGPQQKLSLSEGTELPSLPSRAQGSVTAHTWFNLLIQVHCDLQSILMKSLPQQQPGFLPSPQTDQWACTTPCSAERLKHSSHGFTLP